jgi:hypothetical protein
MGAYLPWLTDATIAGIVGLLALAAMFAVLTLRSWLADMRKNGPAARRKKRETADYGLPDPHQR